MRSLTTARGKQLPSTPIMELQSYGCWPPCNSDGSMVVLMELMLHGGVEELGGMEFACLPSTFEVGFPSGVKTGPSHVTSK